jgi:uncharacterized protein (TIGR02588 family)
MKRNSGNGKNALEWSVFALSLLLVAAMFAVLAVDAATWRGRPAALEASLGPAEKSAGGVRFPVHVINRGDLAAVDVQVEVAADDGSRARLIFDFVPGKGARRGSAVFSAGVTRATVATISAAEP